MRQSMTKGMTLLVGALLALGCTSEAGESTEEQAREERDDDSTGSNQRPVVGNPSSGTQTSVTQRPTIPAPSTPAGPTSPPVAEVQPAPSLQPTPSPPPSTDPVIPPEEQAGTETPRPSTGAVAPVIPAITETCPDFRSGTITFMGLGGIQIVAGVKPSGPTAPMVFYWHGTGSRAGEFASLAGAVRSGVESEGGVLVSFQGTTGGDALSGTSVFGRGDLELVDQLAACAVRDHNVDPRRIFTTGCSAGGLFATNLAMLRSNYIAAAAPNSGGLTFPGQFEGQYTPALMTVHGAPGRDVVIVDFSNTSRTADAAFSGRGGFVVNCNHGGGHCGGGGLAGDIWEFFKAHPYGVEPEPSPWTGGLPSGFSSTCEIFSG